MCSTADNFISCCQNFGRIKISKQVSSLSISCTCELVNLKLKDTSLLLFLSYDLVTIDFLKILEFIDSVLFYLTKEILFMVRTVF